MNLPWRACTLLSTGALLRDCTLLGAGVLMLCIDQQARLDSAPDRAHAWLRCITGGALMFVTGGALIAHTGSVLLDWWPASGPVLPAPPGLLAPLLVLGGLAWREVCAAHAVAALAAPAALLAGLQGAAWAPCAFAALAALWAMADGAHQLGPMARSLALPHHER